MKALVTGAGGFIGSHLCTELLNRGIEIRALALPDEKVDHLRRLPIEISYGDLTRPPSVAGLCDGIDTVFHLAGRVTDWGPRKLFYSVIFDATKNLLDESAGKVERFVYVSSVCACGCGRHLDGQKEDDPVKKIGLPYGDAKLDSEQLVWRYHRERKLAGTVIRPTNAIGPRSIWVSDVLDRLLTSFVPVVDGGRHSASLVYVENLVEGIVLAATLEAGRGRTYHFRDDYQVSWKEYLTDLGAAVGRMPSFSIPYRLAWALGFVLDNTLNALNIRPPITRQAVAIMGRNLDIDTTRARNELGWGTRVPYEEAMERIGEWVATEYLPNRQVRSRQS